MSLSIYIIEISCQLLSGEGYYKGIFNILQSRNYSALKRKNKRLHGEFIDS